MTDGWWRKNAPVSPHRRQNGTLGRSLRQNLHSWPSEFLQIGVNGIVAVRPLAMIPVRDHFQQLFKQP